MINSRTLGTSAGLVTAATFTICGALVAFVPGTLTSLIGWLLHIDLSSMARPISAASFVAGLVLISLFVGTVVGSTSAIYNRLTIKSAV